MCREETAHSLVVHCLGVGSAIVLHRDKCILHQLSEIIHIQPDIVYVHVGENDLHSLHASNVSPITSHLCHIIDKLTPHTRIVFLSQLLLFPVYTHARESVLSVNNNTKCHCAQLESVHSRLQRFSPAFPRQYSLPRRLRDCLCYQSQMMMMMSKQCTDIHNLNNQMRTTSSVNLHRQPTTTKKTKQHLTNIQQHVAIHLTAASMSIISKVRQSALH